MANITKDSFIDKSYYSHELHYKDKKYLLSNIKESNSINYLRHHRMHSTLLPLINESLDNKWLTVGDGLGQDANYLIRHGANVEATDISIDLLEVSLEKGYINKFKKENAENLSYDNNTFDYVLCKESYHHFPRPYIAVYEMLRVAKKGIVLIEPVDIGIQMPLMVYMKNMLDKISPKLINKVWKNRFSFEVVGNYVYKISEREIEKIAMGINLPIIAFKGINDYYKKEFEISDSINNKYLFLKFKLVVGLKNILSRLGIIPYQLQSCIIFKEKPCLDTLKTLQISGYKIIYLKANPYINN